MALSNISDASNSNFFHGRNINKSYIDFSFQLHKRSERFICFLTDQFSLNGNLTGFKKFKEFFRVIVKSWTFKGEEVKKL